MSETSLRFVLVLVFFGFLYSLLMWNAEINQKIKVENKLKELELLYDESILYSDSLGYELLQCQIELKQLNTK